MIQVYNRTRDGALVEWRVRVADGRVSYKFGVMIVTLCQGECRAMGLRVGYQFAAGLATPKSPC